MSKFVSDNDQEMKKVVLKENSSIPEILVEESSMPQFLEIQEPVSVLITKENNAIPEFMSNK